MDGEREEQQEHAPPVGQWARPRINADHHPVEEVARDEEVHLHHDVADMAAHEPSERRGQVEPVEAKDVDDEDVDRVREDPGDPAVQEPGEPLARAALIALRRLERTKCEGGRGPEYEEDWREHRDGHVLEHVKAD